MYEEVEQQAQQEHHEPAPPADPPRELTKVMRRRAWTEPRVRLWWVLALGVLILTLYVVATQAATWLSERRLIQHGTTVEATIDYARSAIVENVTRGRPMPPDSEAMLSFDWNGKKQEVRGQLPEYIERGQNVVVGNKITLHVDPNDPSTWTARTKPAPLLSRQLVGVSVGLPVVAVLALLAILKRRGAVDVYRNGQADSALVVGIGQTPVAPRARGVRCTAADSSDNRVFTVYLPAGAGPVAPGDVLWVMRPDDKPEPAYAAAWFLRETLTP